MPDPTYWFCSTACYEKELDDNLAPDYRHSTTNYNETAEYKSFMEGADDIEDTPENLQTYTAYLRERIAAWKKNKTSAIETAKASLRERLNKETQYQNEKQIWKDFEDVTRQGEIAIKLASQEFAQRFERDRVQAELENEERNLQELIKPKPIPERIRYEHTHILGPSGSGKTTLIQEIILADLARPDPPAMVILDPKGLLVERISKLTIFSDRLKDRLVIVDPTGVLLPALNMFEPPPKGTENQVISNFAYIFSQANAALTAKMRPPFMFAVRLMFTIPSANIFTLMDLFDDDPKQRKFQHHIDKLPDEASRRFFASDFYSSTYTETRQQIKSRLYEIISRPELTEMFNAPVNKLDMFECLQQRKIVLVNTGMMKLGPTGSQLLGRFIISSTLNAAYRRSLIPRDQWNPAYLFIDEFQDFADDEKTPELLRLAREYNLGVILAHQNMHSLELNDALRTTISTNTSIKYCSSPEAIDQAYMARDLRCDTDFFKRFTTTGTFATFARGMNLQHPFLTTVQFGNIDQHPKMSDAAHDDLLLNARLALSGTSKTHKAPKVEDLRAVETMPAEADKPSVSHPLGEPGRGKPLW
jgi:hypothetical protein